MSTTRSGGFRRSVAFVLIGLWAGCAGGAPGGTAPTDVPSIRASVAAIVDDRGSAAVVQPTIAPPAGSAEPQALMPLSEPAALPPQLPDYRLRFSTIDEFVRWLNETGHPSRKSGTKLFKAVGATDGNDLVTDGVEWECYVFSSRTSWADLERRVQAIADSLFLPLGATSYRTYNNVRCLF